MVASDLHTIGHFPNAEAVLTQLFRFGIPTRNHFLSYSMLLLHMYRQTNKQTTGMPDYVRFG